MPYVPYGNVNCHDPLGPVNVDWLVPQLFTATVAPTIGRPLTVLITDPKINRDWVEENTFCGTATSAAITSRHMQSLNNTRRDITTNLKFEEPIYNHYDFDPR